MSGLIDRLWERAIKEHNNGDYHEAHEIFEDIWLELDDRNEKDIVQTLAQADALAVHLETGNLAAAKRLMRQLPELSQTFPNEYRNINLVEFKLWLNQMISIVPDVDNILQISNIKPPKLLNCRKK